MQQEKSKCHLACAGIRGVGLHLLTIEWFPTIDLKSSITSEVKKYVQCKAKAAKSPFCQHTHIKNSSEHREEISRA